MHPEDVGLPLYGDRRRVPGLRREELAQLAGVSISHYTRLGQGQYANISIEVIDAVGRVLRLRAEEREYLHNLVRPPSTASRTRSGAELRTLRHLVDSMTAAPAYITGRYGNALAWNRMTALVLCDFDAVAPGRRT
ncbi:transcriptional regulator with XRE-family HTH domain [Nocardioides luteus]|uniref:HTH cro/C1-type domain-containing protein n=1 Tax=Nocardioides luteus TaxID=1844 RepID=A0ABQ5T2T3_9ACTN|nr:transcriptional regulator with XRE-family HTH domain [Nocardioides luteus]GGR63810.1 hypothetical protein GCM10010197_33980 [Nocardioides luteus]GLJ70431.1 hypothetical protein GCM10017579_44670 [Nocardioides luteus]